MQSLAATSAFAQPTVAITLSQATVSTAADGTAHVAALETGIALAHGAVIRYTITAKDNGSEAARRLALTGHVPAGTSFSPGSVRGPGGHAEFSLDGKSFAAHPMIAKGTPAGDIMVPAGTDAYVMVRWIKDGPLAAQTSTAFSYDVTLK
jgi:uncharacterized repeat protein (TIGR01451 family)